MPATVERAIAGSVEAARWLSAYYATAACGVVDPSRSREWLAHAAAVGDDAAMAQLGYDFKSPYVGVTTFRCGSSTVRIETTCAAYDTREPHACYAQRLVFDGDRSAEYLFFNRDFRTDPFVVAWATCVAAPDEGWVVLESWNGGSGAHCDDCERTDYFTVRGRYLGSTESQAGRRIVPGMKVVSRKTTERIEAARAQRGRAGRIAVIRYPSGR